jgi:small multidrug resistance pump
MAWVLLFVAILAEVTATVCMKLSDGFSKLVPTLGVVLGYGVAFYLMVQVLKQGIPLGTAYAIWAASGVALVSIASVLLFNEHLSGVQIAGLVAVAGGIVALEAGGAH